MNTKNYVSDEMMVITTYLSQNPEIAKHITSLGKSNIEDIKSTDCFLMTDFSDKPLKVEIKMEGHFPMKTKNLTLDAASVFCPKFKIENLQQRFFYNQFVNIVDFDKRYLKGNFYTSNADIVLKHIQGLDHVLAYNNHKLQDERFIDYVEKNCQLKINPKKEYGLDDTWDSAFYLINMYDEEVIKCKINDEKDFINCLENKKTTD